MVFGPCVSGHGEVFECRPGAAAGPRAGTYRRRAPERTLLHEVVRGHLATFLAEARARSAHGFGVPWFVEQELTRYVDCGVLAHGFARVRCARCADEVLVAFSCKGRGVCPACGARRMHETAAHLVARVLPRVPVRQWVLAFPAALRVHLAYDARLLGKALTIFVRAIATFWRARARALGLPVSRAGSSGAVTFVQRFGTALQLTPHFHTLVPDGVFVRDTRAPDACPRFVRLPAPTDADVTSVLTLVRRRILALLVRAGRLAAPGEEADDPDAGDVLPGLLADAVCAPRRRSRGTPRLVLGPEPLTAWEDGCSLHAARLVEPNDREGLAQLCRYGLRPALALDRLARADDGSLRYRLKRRFADETDEIRLTPIEFLRRLAALVPPPRVHQVRYHGAFAPNARGRTAPPTSGRPRARLW